MFGHQRDHDTAGHQTFRNVFGPFRARFDADVMPDAETGFCQEKSDLIFWNSNAISTASRRVMRYRGALLAVDCKKMCSAVLRMESELLQFQMQSYEKPPFLLSLLSYLFSGNNNLREERRMKREK